MATLWCEALTVKIVWHCFSRSGMRIKIVPQSLEDTLGGLSLTRLDIRWAPIKGWQVPQVLAAQIWVVTRCFFISEWNVCLTLFSHRSTPVYKLLISRAQLFSLWLPSGAFLPPEKLRESFYIWSPDLPRALTAKTGEKSHLRPKSQISTHLPTLFSTEWNSWPASFLVIF